MLDLILFVVKIFVMVISLAVIVVWIVINIAVDIDYKKFEKDVKESRKRDNESNK